MKVTYHSRKSDNQEPKRFTTRDAENRHPAFGPIPSKAHPKRLTVVPRFPKHQVTLSPVEISARYDGTSRTALACECAYYRCSELEGELHCGWYGFDLQKSHGAPKRDPECLLRRGK
jgi:hypothetical protein